MPRRWSTIPEQVPRRRLRRARAVRRAGLVLLVAFLGLGALNAFGVRSSTVTAAAGGYRLTVVYASVTRPGLATPWGFEVERIGGFDGPVTVATTARYIALFDYNALHPEPSATTSAGGQLIWEFDPPEGSTLRVRLDGRLEPAVQVGRPSATSVLVNDRPVVTVRYETRVMP